LTLLGRRLGAADPEPQHPDPEDPANQRRQAELFLKVLRDTPLDLSAVQLIVFELNPYNRHRGLFIPVLRQAIWEGSWPEFIKSTTVVDVAAELGPELWFRLDDHITAAGHELLAQRLWEIIRLSPPRDEPHVTR